MDWDSKWQIYNYYILYIVKQAVLSVYSVVCRSCNSSQHIWMSNLACSNSFSCLGSCQRCPNNPNDRCSHSEDVTLQCSKFVTLSCIIASILLIIHCQWYPINNTIHHVKQVSILLLWRNISCSTNCHLSIISHCIGNSMTLSAVSTLKNTCRRNDSIIVSTSVFVSISPSLSPPVSHRPFSCEL